jgi:hypothetical protein
VFDELLDALAGTRDLALRGRQEPLHGRPRDEGPLSFLHEGAAKLRN